MEKFFKFYNMEQHTFSTTKRDAKDTECMDMYGKIDQAVSVENQRHEQDYVGKT